MISALALVAVAEEEQEANRSILVKNDALSEVERVSIGAEAPPDDVELKTSAAVEGAVMVLASSGAAASEVSAAAAAAAATMVANFEIDSFWSLVAEDISVKISLRLTCNPVNLLSTFLSSSVFLEVDVEAILLFLLNLEKIIKIKMTIIAIWAKIAIIRISGEISIPNNSIKG